MKFRTALMAIAACGISFSSFADVKLDLPYQADLVLVNGVEQDGNDTLTLPNGVNQLAFTYVDSLRNNGDDYLYKSDVIVFKFDASDEALKLDLPKLRTAQDARKFNKSPKFSLVAANGEKVSFEQDKLIKSGLQLGRDFEKEIAVYNQSGKVAAVVTTAPAAAVVPVTLPAATPSSTSPKPPVDQQQTRNVAENMLNYWYEQADEATKARFKAKINQE
ncbi:YccT family protein [Photobacterium satsumensis]|uniref:YccT family protein n=1 Tax=Photobacterium satsumensis TaxID=2910239 RepID=UPI003D105F94